jgi:RimJ/RimL family protein N-acetyltransferase
VNVSFGDFGVRDVRMADAPAIAEHADNPRIAANLRDAFPHPYHLEDAVDFLGKVIRQEPRTAFAIVHGDRLIGVIGLVPGEDVHRLTAELGYWLAEPYWGRGIVPEAVRAVVEHGFNELGFVRIFAEPYVGNSRSARVLEKAGFVLEGRLRAHVIKDGQIRDMLLYARVRDDVVSGAPLAAPGD